MKKHKKYGGSIFIQCLPLCIISPSSVLIHRDIFDRYGLFDESLPACEDYDLWLRVCAFEEIVYLEEKLVRVAFKKEGKSIASKSYLLYVADVTYEQLLD